MSNNGEPIDKPESVGLPLSPMMYHLDQVAVFLNTDRDNLISRWIFFVGGSRGRFNPRQIKAVNIAPNLKDDAEWRVTEGELVRWLKLMGIRVYSRGRAV